MTEKSAGFIIGEMDAEDGVHFRHDRFKAVGDYAIGYIETKQRLHAQRGWLVKLAEGITAFFKAN